jgi:macrolide-specific efflux system membrane fusion protein
MGTSPRFGSFAMKKKTIVVVILLAAIATSLFLFLRNSKESELTFHEMKILKGNLNIHILATGTVLPQNRVEIKAPVAGRMEQVIVKEGQRLTKGQIMAWMSSLERAALLDAARAQGESEVIKWSEMYLPTPIVAPISGMLILRSIEPGQTFTNLEPIFTMSDRLTVKAQVDETDISKIKVKTSAIIILDAYPNEPIHASVDQIAFDARIINNVTTYIVDVVPHLTPEFMRSGMTANVTFLLDAKKNILLVPTEALKVESGQTIVNIPGADQKPQAFEIQVGASDGKNTEVVKGLKEGDIVLVPDSKKAFSGQRTSNPFSPFGGAHGSRR